MAREERLGHKPRMYVIDRLTSDFSGYVKANEEGGVATQVVLVTYNRVGEGLLGPRTVKENLTLDIYTGLTMTTITPEQMMSPDTEAGNELPTLLSPEQVADFFGQVRQELATKILATEKPISFVVYGGESQKFRLAIDFVSKLSSLAKMAGKGDLVRFYLLTCSCGLAEKARVASPLYDTGLLESVVYNPSGACGGLTDLQTIAETILNAVPES